MAYSDALIAHREYMDTTQELVGARNLLVFYGVGGIGKTTLSERLEQWSNGDLAPTDAWGALPSTKIEATCRIDLHRTQGRVDVVAALISLRRAFGKVKRRWLAFDLAFAAYWSAIKPGEPLPGAGTNQSAVADGIADSMSEILSELGVPGAGIATRTIRATVGEVRARTERRRLFTQYDWYEDLLTRCNELPTPDEPHLEMVGELASLLDADLRTWEGPQAPLIVAFIDTFERLNVDPRRTDESVINDIVWRMQNVLFVATGRNLVDWYDNARVDLAAFGRARWPGLVPGASGITRQHLVGRLAFEDRIRIITRGCEMYAVEVSAEVARQLASASDGLPQYLDLALEVALNRKFSGGPPIGLDDVRTSLRSLVLQVLEDVPADEQRALRAASMFPFFDSGLIADAAQVDDGCARRALNRAMIDLRGTSTYPFSMHDAIRQAIRYSDHNVPNGWSDVDWREAGELGLRAIRGRYENASASGDTEDTLEALILAIALVSDQELTVDPTTSPSYDDWLSQAIVFGPSVAGLRTALSSQSSTEMGRGIHNFVLAKTNEVTVDEAVELLTGVFESSHGLRFPAARHRGYVLRNASRWEEAKAAFDELAEVSPTALNKYQSVFTLVAARRFSEALDDCHILPPERQESIRISCATSHGRFKGFLERQRELLAKLQNSRRQREAIDKAATIYRWQSIIDRPVALQDLEAHRETAESAKLMGAVRDNFVAMLYSDPARWAHDDTRAWIEGIDRARNFGEIGYRTALIKIAAALHAGNLDELNDLAEIMRAKEIQRSRSWIPVECLLDSYGHSTTQQPVQWQEPYLDVRNRWRGHFDGWLDRVRA